MILNLLLICFLFVTNYECVSTLSCQVFRNGSKVDVDYFISIKIPSTLGGDTYYKKGKGYIYKSNLDETE